MDGDVTAPQPKKRPWQLLIGLLISLIFSAAALRGLDLSEVWGYVRSANVVWLVPALLFYFMTVGTRAWRWQFLLRPLQHVSYTSLFGVVVIGYLGNNIYPFRIGELLRVYLLNRRERVPISAGLATLLVERVFDGVSILIFVFVTLPLAPVPGEEMQVLVWFTSAAFLGTMAAFLLLAAFPERALQIVDWIGERALPAAWYERGREMIVRFLAGLAILKNPATAMFVLFISLLLWVIETFKYWLVMRAFPIDLSFWVLLLMIGIINLATILPSAPGFIGTFDLPGIAVLTLFGVQEEIATAYILVLHAILWLPSVLFGLIYMLYAGLTWSDFDRAAQVAEN